jgi:hypothetical protein
MFNVAAKVALSDANFRDPGDQDLAPATVHQPPERAEEGLGAGSSTCTAPSRLVSMFLGT